MDSPYYYVLNPLQRGALTIENYLLKEKGDWRGYLSLFETGAIDASLFLKKLIRYYATGIESFKNITPINEGVLLALSVWGDEYLHRFLHFCLPSLLEEKNIVALKSRKASMFIHTDSKGQEAICNHPILPELLKHGIQIQMMLLDEELLEMTIHNNKYWHLGMTQSLHLQYAKALGMEYHLMMPDVVYSSEYFQKLFDLQKPIITHSLISADQATLSLEGYREGMRLNIPAAELMSLSLLHSHAHMESYLIKQNRKLPRGHILIFEGKDTVHIMSPHQTIAFMSREYILQIPDRFFFTLDSELDKITDFPLYSPDAKDALVAVEIRGNVQAMARKEINTSSEYCQNFLNRIPSKALHKLFLQGMAMPIERKLLGGRWYMEDHEIAAMKNEVKVALCA